MKMKTIYLLAILTAFSCSQNNAPTIAENSSAVPNSTDSLSFFSATTSAQFVGVWPDDSTAECRSVDYFGNATWRLTAKISEWTRRSLRERQHWPNCEIATPADNCLAVDYEGNSPWTLTADSLKMTSINGDMRGEFVASVGAPSDSGRLVRGTFKGEFKAPIGDSSFTVEGSIEYCGWLTFDGSEYRIMLNVVKGDGGFIGLAGYKESFWLPNDERIYFGGTFRFP